MNCPKCAEEMEAGWLAIYEPLLITRLVWQPVKPQYVRMFQPAGAEKVIQPKFGGKGCPEAQICKKCKTVVFFL